MQKVLAKYKGMAKKKKNGGFTLVELIIVIAIIAVLVAILAPQYLQYVDKSKAAADNSTADQILSAVKVAASDENTSLTVSSTDIVTWTNATASGTTGSNVAVNGPDATNIQAALASAIGITFTGSGNSYSGNIPNTSIKSAAYKTGTYTVKIVIDGKGVPTVSATW